MNFYEMMSQFLIETLRERVDNAYISTSDGIFETGPRSIGSRSFKDSFYVFIEFTEFLP